MQTQSSSSTSRLRTFFSFGVAFAIAVVVLTALAALLHLRQLADLRVATTTQSLARSLELTFEGMIDPIDIALQSATDEFSRQLSTGAVDLNVIARVLARQKERLPAVDNLRGANEQGAVIYGPGVLSPPTDVADRDYFNRLRDDRTVGLVAAKPAIGRITKAWRWAFARRINKPDGSFGGIVFATIDIDRIEAMLAELKLAAGGVIALRDGDLDLIARFQSPDGKPVIPGDRQLSTPFLESLKINPLEGTYVSGATGVDGISRTFSYRRNAKYGFTVVVGISREAALADWRKQTEIVAGLVIAFLIATLASARQIKRDWRRQDEQVAALLANRKALHEAQELASLGSYTYDVVSNRWTSSDILDGIFGIDDGYMRDAQHWLELIVPESRQEMQAYLASVLSQGLSFDRQYRILRPCDGRVRWVHGKGRLRFDAAGNPSALFGTIQDITEPKAAEEALDESRDLLQTVIDTAPIRVFWKDRELRYLGCNPAFAADAGKADPDEVIGKDDYQMAWADQADLYRADDRIVIESGIPRLFYQEPLTLPDGQARWIRTAKVPLKNRHDETIGVLGIFEDITEQKKVDVELRLAASVFAHSYDGIMITDAANRIVNVNPAFTRISGYARDEAIGQTPKLLASGRHGPDFYARIWKSLENSDFWHGEIWNRRKNGELYAEMLAVSVVRDDTGKLSHHIGIFSDISRIKEHEADLHHIAHYDPLTGVPNRRLLADRLGQAIAHARRSGKSMAVCYLDLDGFKPINDRYGHEAGDRFLVIITERLKDVLRAEDTLARLGGDEFVLLFTDLAQPEEIHRVLDRVLSAIRAPVPVDNTTASVSASIGATLFPDDDGDADTLMRHADQAMYRAKDEGKNRYCLFDPHHDRQLQAHLQHQQDLREALAQSEFVLHYQPKVDLVSGEVVGAEALLRWQHPERGLLLPGAFLHHLVGGDIETSLGEWVIDTVLKQIAAWDALGLSLCVSANISADHLLQSDFAERLRQTLERHPGVAAGSLGLEILETAALADIRRAEQTLIQCQHLGVHFALDDFGTGYSSLTYLRSLPVAILKIDQSFVRGMLDDPEDLCIVESVVRLARSFGRSVIAEGVETLAHGAALITLGCSLAQGYGIAYPMPADQLPGWIDRWRDKAAWLSLDGHAATGDTLPLKVAAQSHQKWIKAIVEHLEHPDDQALVELDSERCGFGRWYNGAGSASFGAYGEFQAIAPQHQRVHAMAAELTEMAKDGQPEAARRRLPELYEERDLLLQLLESLAGKMTRSQD